MTSFVLVDNSSLTDAQYGGPLTPEILAQIADACELQLNRDLAPEWGGDYRVRAATPDNPPTSGEIVAAILDDLPNAPGAIAYHDWQGVPVIYAARRQCPSLTTGSQALSVALSHEFCETAGDFGCNLWADDGSSEWATELCDAVEGNSYDCEGVSVSDFLTRAFFAAGAPAPYHFRVSVPGPGAPFQTAPGGYQIKRLSGTGEAQVWGDIAPHRAAHKAHWSSRTSRRGARLKS